MPLNWLPSANSLIVINVVWYLLLAVAFAFEGNIGKVPYWTGAAILSVGVMFMK